MIVADVDIKKTTAAKIERLAWIIIVVSFILFCSLFISASGVLYYFFFRSVTNVDVIAQVGRGSAGLRTPDFLEQVIRAGENDLHLNDRPATISTDAQSQTVISFFANSNPEDDTVVATLTLENSTTIIVNSATQPRFTWSQGDYRVELSGLDGEVDVFISEVLAEPFRMEIKGTNNVGSIWISDPGRYSIEANDVSLRLITREGRAAIIPRDQRNNRFVTSGEEAILGIGSSTPVVQATRRNLLENGLFSFDVFTNPTGNELTTPVRWGCYDQVDAAPGGRSFPDVWQSRPALRLLRTDGAASHGQTGCYQILATDPGIDVQEYTFLELQTTFLINYQSLSVCGVDGSECPVMLFVYYTDVNNVPRQWYQGFYYNSQSQTIYPPTCITCGQSYEHRRIGERVWYTFESGNLMSRFAPGERPAYIQRVVFYASGHQYDVFVSEISLLAGAEEVIPQQVTIDPVPITPTPVQGG